MAFEPPLAATHKQCDQCLPYSGACPPTSTYRQTFKQSARQRLCWVPLTSNGKVLDSIWNALPAGDDFSACCASCHGRKDSSHIFSKSSILISKENNLSLVK
jgi:hypothetical protein